MNKKVLLSCCIAASFAFTGCKKVPAILQGLWKKAPAEAAQQATPAPTPEPVAAPTPPPVVAINKNAAAICLCYHNIEDNSKMRALTITTEQFEKEMQALKDNGFSVIGMQDFLAWRRGEKDIPAKSAIITIDDGWVSTYENAWPILKKFGYPFTVFIYINYVGTGGKSLSWDQLAELRDAGVDIEAHSYSHSSLRSPGGGVDRRTADLVRKDVAALGVDGWMRKEIIESKRTLEKQLGIRCNVFAYPFGIYNSKARELVKEAGYEAAFTVYGQQLRFSSPPYDLLGRYAIDAKKAQIFADALKMIGGGVSGTPMPASGTAQLAATSMITQPMDGETINDPTPLIKANLATMGKIDPGSVKMRISGIGEVPAKYDAATKTVSYQVPQKLRYKTYSVILGAKVQGRPVETRWSFQFDPNAGAAQEPAYSLPATQ